MKLLNSTGPQRSLSATARCIALTLFVGFTYAPQLAANERVEWIGYVAMKSVDCFNPELHDHEPAYFVVDDATGLRVRLTGHAALLRGLHPKQKVRVVGIRRNAQVNAVTKDGRAAVMENSDTGSDADIEIQEMEALPLVEEGVAELEPRREEGGNSLTMLSTLLVFISTDTHACMTIETHARNLLFNNATNANLGMQAITKGRYGLQLGNGTGLPDDHAIDLLLNVNSADHDSDSIETLALNALFGAGGMGLNRLAYDRILLFAPGGITDAGFTAYGYYPGGAYTTKGMVTMYGNSYGNTRMNGFLHELGHNFGFAHSSKGTSEYGDRTCVMGLSNDGTRTETYGAAKLMETDWLAAFPGAATTLTTDTTIHLHPLSSDPNVVTGTIAVSIAGTDYYVAYHRNDLPYGFLSQTADRDRVFVYTRATGNSQRSFQVANLSEESRFTGPVDVSFNLYGPGNAYASVSIDINDGNAKPVLAATTFGTGQNTPVVLNLAATDADNDPLTYAMVTNPGNGSLSGTLPNLSYTPNTNFLGSDSFRFLVNDGLISNYIRITVLVFVDMDGDGLDDAWEMRYFGHLAQGPNNNPDGDRENNLLEFQNGTDPTRAPTLFAKLSGTVIGSAGSYLNNTAWDKDEAHDGDLTTFYDAANASGDWTGLDLGSPKKIGQIRYAPRSTWPTRMTGGKFQASNSANFSSGVVTFHTVVGTPAAGALTAVAVNNAGTYRYVRYLGPDNGYCNVAEIEFHEDGGPDAPTGLLATPGTGGIALDWNNNSDADFASYNVYRGTSTGTYGLTPIATGLTQSQYSDTTVVNGNTYYYVVSAEDSDGLQSANSNEASATRIVNNFAPVVNAGPDQNILLSGGAAWTPAQVALTGWYDAADAATLTLSGNAVSQWRDKSGNNLHLDQGDSTRRPLTGVNTINGLTTLKFDGSNDTLVTSTNPFAPTISNAMVFAVHRVDATTNGTLFNLSGTGASPGRWQAHAPFGSTFYFDAGSASGGARLSAAYGVVAGDVVLLSLYSSVAGSVQQVHKNGAFFLGDATAMNTTTVGNIFVGSGANEQFQNTSIAEMILINGSVGSDDRQKVEGYLAHKWGLAANLPADHPHKAAPPGGSGASVQLAGTVSDADGIPPSTTWTKVSGPGPVSFSNASAVDTSAVITEPGTYVLRLTAFDGFHTVSDDVTLTVIADENTNDIDDAWEMANLSRLPGEAETHHESGVAYYFLYLSGWKAGDPLNEVGHIGVVRQVGGANPVMSWDFAEGFELGEHVEIRFSTDLVDWDPLPTDHFTHRTQTNSGKTRHELEVTHDYGGSVFLRLQKP